MYEGIPSLNYRYEIDSNGCIRNAATKQAIKNRRKHKHRRCVSVALSLNGKQIKRTIGSLLAEVWGTEVENPFAKPSVGVTIIKGAIRKSFNSRSKCAAYLVGVTCYKRSNLMRLMARRDTEIDGWQLMYREPEQRIFRSVTLINGDTELRRK